MARAAVAMGRLALDLGDPQTARWASSQGLRASPVQQALFQVEMRAAAELATSTASFGPWRRQPGRSSGSTPSAIRRWRPLISTGKSWTGGGRAPGCRRHMIAGSRATLTPSVVWAGPLNGVQLDLPSAGVAQQRIADESIILRVLLVEDLLARIDVGSEESVANTSP